MSGEPKDPMPPERMAALLRQHPALQDFMSAYQLPLPGPEFTVDGYFASLPEAMLSDRGTSAALLLEHFRLFLRELSAFAADTCTLRSLELIGGCDKHGREENLRLRLVPGDVLSIVGPTGAGKSRLLEDIECLAQGDTPTRRQVLINGVAPDDDLRFGSDHRLVAQLSQNMNFVVDLCVADFLAMHAESRLVENPHRLVEQIFTTANRLAGEEFRLDTPVTALSGGQSRALMIADTACLSRSPVVLIDEIENAGVDRNQALELLVRQEKIVLLVTHDPALALMAPRRLVIRDGGMKALIERSAAEEQLRDELLRQAEEMAELRRRMRNGERF